MQYQNKNLTKFDQSDCSLNPGDAVEQSGIYEICHADEPRAAVVLTRNSFFPFCKRCGEAVRFKLIHAAPHIAEDPDFMEAVTETDNSLLNRGTPMHVFPMQLGMAHGFRFQEIVQSWRSSSEGGDL
jgi:hypothetical protein